MANDCERLRDLLEQSRRMNRALYKRYKAEIERLRDENAELRHHLSPDCKHPRALFGARCVDCGKVAEAKKPEPSP